MAFVPVVRSDLTFQCARYLYVNSEPLTSKPALDEVILRRGIRFNRNKAVLTHDTP